MTGVPVEPSPFTTVEVADLLDAGFLSIQRRTLETPTGARVERYVVVHPGAVAIVPIDGEDVVLIEQYRAPIDATVLEIPAGKLDDPSHDRGDTARRELEEETGLIASELTLLTDLWTGVGFTDECISIYLAEGLTAGVRTPVGAEEEAATIVRMPFTEAVEAVVSGRITDAKSVAGILLAAARRDAP